MDQLFERLRGGLAELTDFAPGRRDEAARKRDLAALAFGRFSRLRDKAGPQPRGRVAEAREALRRLTEEPRP